MNPFISLKQIRLSGFSQQHGIRTMANSDGTLTVELLYAFAPSGFVTIPTSLYQLKIELGY